MEKDREEKYKAVLSYKILDQRVGWPWNRRDVSVAKGHTNIHAPNGKDLGIYDCGYFSFPVERDGEDSELEEAIKQKFRDHFFEKTFILSNSRRIAWDDFEIEIEKCHSQNL